MRDARTPETHDRYVLAFRQLQRSGAGHVSRDDEIQLDQFWIDGDCTPDTDDWKAQNDAVAAVLTSRGGHIRGVGKLEDALAQQGLPREWSEVTFWEHLDHERIFVRPVRKYGRWYQWELALRSRVHCLGCFELI